MGLSHRVGWDPHFTRRSAWFWPLGPASARLSASADWPGAAELEALCAELTAGTGAPRLRLGPNVDRRDKRADGRVRLEALYDARIATRAEVPTRERDWHDLFNVLCFATFPLVKHALHARQYAALRRRVEPGAATLPGSRTREQDALTLFDEGGVIVAASPRWAAQLVAAGDGLGAALALAPVDAELAVIAVGHALYEHLVEGLMMPGARAMVCALEGTWPRDDAAVVAAADRAFARVVADEARFASPREQVHLRLTELTPGQRRRPA